MVTDAQRAHLDAVTRLTPNYDAWATAGDCVFDYERAQDACDFFPECLVHVKGEWAGRPIVLEPWQQGVIANLFGWYRPDRTRRYRSVLVYVPRKNAKTTIAAGIALYLLFCDGEAGAEIYGAAANEEQAGICFTVAKGMVVGCTALAKRGKIFKRAITFERTMSAYHVISSKAATKHGFNPSGAIIDELHAQKDSELVDVLTTGMGSRRQPLTVYLTTADFAKPGICNDTHKYASDVANRIIDDPSFLPVVYEATVEDDWTSEEVWRKANPNLGVSIKLDYIREQCKKAQDSPVYENTFKRLHLNIITEQANRWLQLIKWDACVGVSTVEQLEKEMVGELCYAGVDLATNTDLAALALAFPPTPTRATWRLLVKTWAPKDSAIKRQARDRVPYLVWAKQGFLKLTLGDVVDYDVIRADINALAKLYKIRHVGLDPHNATHLMKQLGEDGLDVMGFQQGMISMAAPTQEFERLVLSGSLIHGGNPLLRWCASNIAVVTDAVGNMKPSKKKSTERIDPIVAAIMAIGLHFIGEPPPPPSKYEIAEGLTYV